jgi:glycosyltransferase involved in cell wall biosynthesis
VRIAILCSDLGVRIPGEKGASLHLAAVAKALRRAGHDVMLIAVAGHGPPPAGLETQLFEHPGRTSGLRRELRKLAFVERMARDARGRLGAFAPHVVYERLSLFGTAGVRLAAGTGALFAVEVNALIAEEESRWRGLKLAGPARRRERRVLSGAELRVAVSEELARRVRLIPGGETAVVSNGVDAAAFAQLPGRIGARRALGLPEDAPAVGFLGSFRPWHGLEIAIEALRELPSGLLLIAGDGEIRPALEARAIEAGVADRVRWLGWVRHQQVPRFLATLDVAILPYPALRDFAFSPLKLYEYLAAGVPVVASDVGQVREALDGGRLGTLVRPGDAGALAEGIRTVLANRERSRALAAVARKRALKEHSWDERVQRLAQLFADRLPGALAA